MLDSNITSDDDVSAMNFFIKNELNQDIETQYIDEQSLLLPHSESEEITEKLIIDDDDDDCFDYFYCHII